MRTFDGSPKAASLIESMRDIGYSLETAVADVVDNSITAGARHVAIYAQVLESGFAIAICDDGEGMSEPELFDAMRPGSTNPMIGRASKDLGRFGLGLKTASFSQCRRMTVVTRKDGQTSTARWDLDFVAVQDQWLVQVPSDIGGIPWFGELGQHGTLVVWEELDRVVGALAGAEAAQHFDSRISDLADHLGLVFHRFLSGGPWSTRKVSISINRREVESFDPFHLKHPATQKHPEENIALRGSRVVVQAFTLPHHGKVSSAEWKKYGGRDGYLKNQGFYVYRENRLILHGTWFALAAQAELTKLARVRIDFPNELDADWKIDVRKASVQPPPAVRRHLRNLVDRLGGTSKRVYRHRGTRLVAPSSVPTWDRIQQQGRISYRVRADHPVIEKFRSTLPVELHPSFDVVLNFVSAAFPIDSLFADMGGGIDEMGNAELPDEVIREAATTLYNSLMKSGVAPAMIREAIIAGEPFASNREQSLMVLDDLAAHPGES